MRRQKGDHPQKKEVKRINVSKRRKSLKTKKLGDTVT